MEVFFFVLISQANGTDLGEFKVFRGAKHTEDIGRVVAFNEEEEMSYWDGDECNQYVGTDSTIFPPYMKPSDGIWAHEPSVCRALGATYSKPSKYMGVPTLQYDLDIGSDVNVKECFCRDPPNGCPPKGTFDLFRCVGSPMMGSLPHFYKADPKLLGNIASGLNPNEEQHGIFIHFEIVSLVIPKKLLKNIVCGLCALKINFSSILASQMSGTPLSAAKRLQFNLEVVPIEQVPIMQNVQPMLYPLFWVEESANLNKTYVDMLKNSLFL